jgi:hypothetical protein
VTVQPTLEEELLADLRITRQVLVERGHTQGYLINPQTDAVCLTGAAGIAVQGVQFIDWVKAGHHGSFGEGFGWDSRTVRLLEALAAGSPRHGIGRRAMNRFIRGIVGYNDGHCNMEEALRWVDTAIEHAEKAVAEAGRMSAEEEL